MAEKAEIVLSARDDTKAAFGTATRNLELLKTSAVGIGGVAARLSGIGAAIGVALGALERVNPAPVIEQADALNKLTQRTGIAVETLSAYQYAAKLADVSNEDLATGFKKLNQNIAAAARGETEQAGAFKAIGVSVVDASGKVRSADKVFEDIAERFSTYEDGANKVAIANAVGGKSFEKLIPLLNGGKKGFQDTREELEKFGGVITKEFAAKAEQFNDNLTKLEQSSQRLKVEIASGLIDSLVRVSDRFVEAAKDGNLLLGVLAALSEANTAQKAGSNAAAALFGTPTELEKVTESARHFNKVVESTQALLAADPGNQALADKLQRVKQQADAANESLRGLRIGGGRGVVNPDLVIPDKSPSKPDAPKLPGSTGADNRDAVLRKQLEGRLKEIQAGLERERDLFQFADQRLNEQYQHSELSINAYFDAKNKALSDSVVAQQAGFDKLIAAQRAYEAAATKPQDKEDARNKIAEFQQQQAKVLREAGQAAEVAETQRQRAIEDFRRSLSSLDAQLAELSGNRYGAELLRNAQQFDDARKLLEHGGVDTGRALELKRLADNQAALNEQETRYGQLKQRSQIAEEAFFLIAQRDGLSRAEIEKQVSALRAKALEDLDALIAKTRELVAANPSAENTLKLQGLLVDRARAFAEANLELVRFNQLAEEAGSRLAQGFEDAIVEGGKLSDQIKAVEKDLVRLITREGVTKPLEGFFTKSLKDLFGINIGGAGSEQTQAVTLNTEALRELTLALGIGGSGDTKLGGTTTGGGIVGLAGKAVDFFSKLGGNNDAGIDAAGHGYSAAKDGAIESGSSGDTAASTVSTIGTFFNIISKFFHEGGVVGSGGSGRSVNPLAFSGATRYHSGGIAGLKADEVPAILRRGEEVLTEKDARHRNNGGGGGDKAPMIYSPQFVLQQPASLATQQQLAKTAFESAQRAYARNK